MPPLPPPPSAPFEDRVLECATLARKLAPTSCRAGAFFESNCVWYHGIWPYLRATGMVSTPTVHAEFYAETLGALAQRDDMRRVLISGSSDSTMLQHVFSAFGAETDPDIYFTDICETPVKLAEWYAAVSSRKITAIATDILTFKSDKPFDVICTHAFMGSFNEADRLTLVRNWRDLLRPGGKIVTINRIRPYADADVICFDEEQIERFVAKARAAIEQRPEMFDITADEMAAAARKYGETFEVYPIRSLEDIDRIFRNNGFDIELLEVRYVAGTENSKGGGPTVPEGAAYAHIIVTRI